MYPMRKYVQILEYLKHSKLKVVLVRYTIN